MKKCIALVMTLTILTLYSSAYATYKDVPENAAYYKAVERVSSLGLMDSLGDSNFKPAEATTREQFAKLIVLVSGLSDAADTMKGSTVFSDVAQNGIYNGYINVCLTKGYMAGLADGKFHPAEPVTYAQAVTAIIRALGYSDSDIPGTWPKNYIEKAKALGIAEGLSLNSGSKVPRWAMAQMLDVVLDTKVKTNGTQDIAKTLSETSGLTVGTMYSVYSKPEVYYSSNVMNSRLGNVDLSGKLDIVRNSVDHSTNPDAETNGESIKPTELKDFNVVYQVSDKSGMNKFVLVIDNQITGTLTGILPNKYAPQQVEVDGKAYQLDKSFLSSKLTGTGSFNLDDGVTLLLGVDGKVVDILETLYTDNSSFAFVMNYTAVTSNETATYGLKKYSVKLLMVNGSVNTFDTGSDPSSFKGKLVIFKKNPDGSVTLVNPNYSTTGEISIDKENKKILSNYGNYSNDISGNVKIFNYISNEEEVDAQAAILSWSDLPSGVLQSGKVLFLNKTGSFEDVNLILLNNVSLKEYKLGIVKGVKSQPQGNNKSYVYTLAVDGKEITYTASGDVNGVGMGSVVKVSMNGNIVNNILEIKYPDTQSSMIQAVDKDRIRANSRSYTFADDKLIYLLDQAGKIKTIETSQLRTDELYDQVAIYTDIAFASGGEAELIVVRSK